MINLQEELKIKIVSPFWEEAYQRALLDSEQPEWLTADYIKYLNREIGIVAEHEEQVLDALERVVKDKKLNLLAKTLYHILSVCKVSEEAITEMEYPRNPPEDVDVVGYRFVLLFPMLAHVKTAYDAIVGKGIDETIAKKTFKAFDACITLSTVKVGYPCFSVMYFRWNFLYINQRMYRIGRFEFEIIPKINEPVRAFMSKKGQITTLMDNAKIHKSGHLLGAAGCTDEVGAYYADFLETEDYYEGYAVNADSHLVERHKTKLLKSDWEPIFKSGDMLVGVHIPAEEKLDRATCIYRLCRNETL